MTRQELFNELALKVTAERSVDAVVLDEVLQLRAENERMKAELAEAKKDAERYRWIRKNPEWVGYDSDYRPDEIDASTDRAMKGK